MGMIFNYSFIGGGECNLMVHPTNYHRHSFIGGGQNNTMSASCSAILGGIGNTVTHAYAAVFGCNVSSVASNTFHVECLNALNTPPYIPATYPPGTLTAWALPAPALGLAAGTKIIVIT